MDLLERCELVAALARRERHLREQTESARLGPDAQRASLLAEELDQVVMEKRIALLQTLDAAGVVVR